MRIAGLFGAKPLALNPEAVLSDVATSVYDVRRHTGASLFRSIADPPETPKPKPASRRVR